MSFSEQDIVIVLKKVDSILFLILIKRAFEEVSDE